jgi:hypothetical protein
MILSEFVLTNTKGHNALDLVYFADVTVTTTTGALWWKKKHVVRRKISRKYTGMWFFVDNGEATPEMQAENLERSYIARNLLTANETELRGLP